MFLLKRGNLVRKNTAAYCTGSLPRYGAVRFATVCNFSFF